MRIVFDLDGTLADADHRQHFIDGEKKDWDGYFAACDRDAPIWPALETLSAFYQAEDHTGREFDIEIWSGRGEGPGCSVRTKTYGWLCTYLPHVQFRAFPFPEGYFVGAHMVPLRMRDHTDYTPDHALKRQWLDDCLSQGAPPDLVFDDRNKVVAMWREAGIPCFQVAPGNF